ncbi:MAG: GyrI-like domain-containing protein [Nitrospirae bacterium]|nr:GyrI-like domain-containing protein [Nitrospirota bacterium]
MAKIDYKKDLKHLYNSSSKEVTIVDVPEMNFLMIDGEGDPNNSQAFHEAIEALFTASYTLKFMIKKDKEGIDYGVMPLEGLWWADDMLRFNENKDKWKWTIMIMQPEHVTAVLVDEAISQAVKKKGLPALSKIRFETFSEGKSAQIMHIGPFSEEGPTIERIHAFIEEKGFRLSGKHHEIYLSDVRKAAPEKWKTIIRQPIEKRTGE